VALAAAIEDMGGRRRANPLFLNTDIQHHYFREGLADPNLSLLAWRGQRVIDRLDGMGGGRGRSTNQLPSFVSWAPVGGLTPAERASE